MKTFAGAMKTFVNEFIMFLFGKGKGLGLETWCAGWFVDFCS